MDPVAPPPQQDYGVTHGLDFARWITEIANLLKKADASDPTVQVAFLEIAKSLERLRRYKKDLVLGTYKTYLTVNESVVTSFPTAEIVAAPMVRLMDEDRVEHAKQPALIERPADVHQCRPVRFRHRHLAGRLVEIQIARE